MWMSYFLISLNVLGIFNINSFLSLSLCNPLVFPTALLLLFYSPQGALDELWVSGSASCETHSRLRGVRWLGGFFLSHIYLGPCHFFILRPLSYSIFSLVCLHFSAPCLIFCCWSRAHARVPPFLDFLSVAGIVSCCTGRSFACRKLTVK